MQAPGGDAGGSWVPMLALGAALCAAGAVLWTKVVRRPDGDTGPDGAAAGDGAREAGGDHAGIAVLAVIALLAQGVVAPGIAGGLQQAWPAPTAAVSLAAICVTFVVVLVPAVAAARALDPRAPEHMGLRLRPAPWRDVLGGVAAVLAAVPLTLGVAAAARAAMEAAGMTDPVHPVLEAFGQAGPGMRALMITLAVTAVPVGEEVLYRGMVQGGLQRIVGPTTALLLASAVFAAAHAAAPSSVPALFVFALLAGRLLQVRGSLLGPIVLHALFNGANFALRALESGSA